MGQVELAKSRANLLVFIIVKEAVVLRRISHENLRIRGQIRGSIPHLTANRSVAQWEELVVYIHCMSGVRIPLLLQNKLEIVYLICSVKRLLVGCNGLWPHEKKFSVASSILVMLPVMVVFVPIRKEKQIYGVCSSEEERSIVIREVGISKFLMHPNGLERLKVDGNPWTMSYV